MEWSSFVQRIKSNDGFILRNYYNDSIIALNNTELNEIEFFLKEKANHSISNKNILFLIKHNFIVDSTISEKKKYLSNLLEDIENDDFLCIHYVPTSRCNFLCPYCYQKGIDKQKDLSIAEIDSFIDFFCNYIIRNNIKTLNFVLHGGEPTINWESIEYILPKVFELCKKNEIDFFTQIVTNGYSLSLDKVQFLAHFNLRRIQVTLDGDREHHDKRRIFFDGSGTYDVIVNNIKSILDNGFISSISLRLNIDKSNYENIKTFIPKIATVFPPSKISLSLGFITGTITNDSKNYFTQNGFSEYDLGEKYVELYKIAIQNSFELPDAYTVSSFCTAKMKHSFIFTPKSLFYKCLSFVGREDFSIGDLATISDERIQKNLFIDSYKNCLDKNCVFFPLCKSACRFENFLHSSIPDKTYCNKKLIEYINSEITKIRSEGKNL